MGLDFSVIPPYFGAFLVGAGWTIAILLTSALVSFFGGIIFAVCALYAPAVIRLPVKAFAWLFMGTPLLLQLFMIYFGLIQIGIDLPAFVAGVIALGLHYAVYISDIIQAGILAVDKGQEEGARTLGLSRGQAIFSIIIPQAVRSVVPPIGNMMIALLKDSALVSVIGVAELTLTAQQGISRTFRAFEFYLAAAAIYYAINLVLEAGLRRIERRIALTK